MFKIPSSDQSWIKKELSLFYIPKIYYYYFDFEFNICELEKFKFLFWKYQIYIYNYLVSPFNFGFIKGRFFYFTWKNNYILLVKYILNIK